MIPPPTPHHEDVIPPRAVHTFGSTGLEDHAAVACATQNFMLSLANEGIGSKWMTGALGAAPEDVLAAVSAGEGERLIGAIW